MILELLRNKELVYITIAILSLVLVLLILIITKKNKKVVIENNNEENKVNFVKVDEKEEVSSDLEEVLKKMQESTSATPDEAVDYFEKEQEEKAIISYQELLKANKKEDINEANNEIIEETNDEEPIEILDDIPTQTDEIRKFKNTELISPIYGKQETKYKYPTIPSFNKESNLKYTDINNRLNSETSINIKEQLEEPEKKVKYRTEEANNNSQEFLDYLKDFRKNLD